MPGWFPVGNGKVVWWPVLISGWSYVYVSSVYLALPSVSLCSLSMPTWGCPYWRSADHRQPSSPSTCSLVAHQPPHSPHANHTPFPSGVNRCCNYFSGGVALSLSWFSMTERRCIGSLWRLNTPTSKLPIERLFCCLQSYNSGE